MYLARRDGAEMLRRGNHLTIGCRRILALVPTCFVPCPAGQQREQRSSTCLVVTCATPPVWSRQKRRLRSRYRIVCGIPTTFTDWCSSQAISTGCSHTFLPYATNRLFSWRIFLVCVTPRLECIQASPTAGVVRNEDIPRDGGLITPKGPTAGKPDAPSTRVCTAHTRPCTMSLISGWFSNPELYQPAPELASSDGRMPPCRCPPTRLPLAVYTFFGHPVCLSRSGWDASRTLGPTEPSRWILPTCAASESST